MEKYMDYYKVIPELENDVLNGYPSVYSIKRKLKCFITEDTNSLTYIEFENTETVDYLYSLILDSFGGNNPKKLLQSSGIRISKVIVDPFSETFSNHNGTTGLSIITDNDYHSKVCIEGVDGSPKYNFGITHYERGSEDYIKYLMNEYRRTNFVDIIDISNSHITTYTNNKILNGKGINKTANITIVLAAGEKFQL